MAYILPKSVEFQKLCNNGPIIQIVDQRDAKDGYPVEAHANVKPIFLKTVAKLDPTLAYENSKVRTMIGIRGLSHVTWNSGDSTNTKALGWEVMSKLKDRIRPKFWGPHNSCKLQTEAIAKAFENRLKAKESRGKIKHKTSRQNETPDRLHTFQNPFSATTNKWNIVKENQDKTFSGHHWKADVLRLKD